MFSRSALLFLLAAVVCAALPHQQQQKKLVAKRQAAPPPAVRHNLAKRQLPGLGAVTGLLGGGTSGAVSTNVGTGAATSVATDAACNALASTNDIVGGLVSSLLDLVSSILKLVASLLSTVTGLLGGLNLPGLSALSNLPDLLNTATGALTPVVSGLTNALPLPGGLGNVVNGALGSATGALGSGTPAVGGTASGTAAVNGGAGDAQASLSTAQSAASALETARNSVAQLQQNQTILAYNQAVNNILGAATAAQQQFQAVQDNLNNNNTANLTSAQIAAQLNQALGNLNKSQQLASQLVAGGPMAQTLDDVTPAAAALSALLNSQTIQQSQANLIAIVQAQNAVQNATQSLQAANSQLQDQLAGIQDATANALQTAVGTVTNQLVNALGCPDGTETQVVTEQAVVAVGATAAPIGRRRR